VNKNKYSIGQETFIKELAWRDFYNMIHHYNQNQKDEEIIKKYRNILWSNDEDFFNLWKEGNTGFPIIDAAMRQLKKEGWMHNRLRMIVSSFLVKDLLIDWRLGERYFSEMLIDYDSSSNIGGWQWSASVGIDAQPYFRIFNPTIQSQKFDEEGLFIKKYVKELKSIPSKYIHEPYKYEKELRSQYGIEISEIYRKPIVNHKEQKLKALEMFNI
ncbi:MAG: FAD-binding domain-containing protein, partial [Bacilli bacterium]|nr:FAD-binding domain-containing protein [Bacilli bacterium]